MAVLAPHSYVGVQRTSFQLHSTGQGALKSKVNSVAAATSCFLSLADQHIH